MKVDVTKEEAQALKDLVHRRVGALEHELRMTRLQLERMPSGSSWQTPGAEPIDLEALHQRLCSDEREYAATLELLKALLLKL